MIYLRSSVILLLVVLFTSCQFPKEKCDKPYSQEELVFKINNNTDTVLNLSSNISLFISKNTFNTYLDSVEIEFYEIDRTRSLMDYVTTMTSSGGYLQSFGMYSLGLNGVFNDELNKPVIMVCKSDSLIDNMLYFEGKDSLGIVFWDNPKKVPQLARVCNACNVLLMQWHIL